MTNNKNLPLIIAGGAGLAYYLWRQTRAVNNINVVLSGVGFDNFSFLSSDMHVSLLINNPSGVAITLNSVSAVLKNGSDVFANVNANPLLKIEAHAQTKLDIPFSINNLSLLKTIGALFSAGAPNISLDAEGVAYTNLGDVQIKQRIDVPNPLNKQNLKPSGTGIGPGVVTNGPRNSPYNTDEDQTPPTHRPNAPRGPYAGAGAGGRGPIKQRAV